MSSLIEQAILDAKELKEAAIKNAEQLIIEKYAQEIKSNLETLLEQDMGTMPAITPAPAMPGVTTPAQPPVDAAMAAKDKDNVPTQLEYAAFDGLTIGKTKYPELNEEVEIDLTSLSEYELNPKKGPTQKNLKESFDISEDALREMLSDLSGHGADYTMDENDSNMDLDTEESEEEYNDSDLDFSTEEEKEEDENLLSSSFPEEEGDEQSLEEEMEELEEATTVDFNPHYTADRDWGFGSNTAETNHAAMLSDLYDQAQGLEKENASLKEQNEVLKKKLAEASKLIAEAHKEHSSIKESFHSMKGKLAEVQLINAKLLYSNKVLTDASLNERQKIKIVESLSNAESLEKVKIVYETLQSAVEDNTSRAPKSLSEAVSRRSSPLLIKANRREDRDANPVNETLSRMRILAGINNK